MPDLRVQAVRVPVAAAAADALGDALLACGADSVSAEAANGASALYGEPGCDPAAYWAECVLRAIFPAGVDVTAAVALAAAAVGVVAQPLGPVELVPDLDWVRASQDGFAPWWLTPTLVVAPPWRAAEVRCAHASARVVVVDPGPAFGTGDHPTTRLCAVWLARVVRGGEGVLDFGCGTGILGLVALASGAGRALGVDVDPAALAAADANARASRLPLELAGGIPPGFWAELVVANILAGPLVAAAGALVGALTGALALSGVRAEEAATVQGAYARATRGALVLDVEGEEGGWVLLVGRIPA